MSKFQVCFFGSLLVLSAGCEWFSTDQHSFKSIKVSYPKTPKDLSVVDTFFGTSVPDPYRWLENRNSPTVKDWIVAQRQTTQNYLKKIPFHDELKGRLQELWDYERYAAPERAGDFYYILENNALQNHKVLYRFRNLQDTTWTVVLDPNRLSKDGSTALGDFSFSRDGSLLAYEISENGSDWRTILLRDLSSNRPLLDTLRWVKYSNISWFRDGFYYSRFATPAPDNNASGQVRFQQVYYHRVGTPQENDVLVFADRTHSRRNFSTYTTKDERFLILYAMESPTENALYFKDLTENPIEFTPVVENYNSSFKVVGNVGNNLFVLTNYKAPKYRVIRVNTVRPEERYWEDIIPESEDVLQTVHFFGGKMVATYIHDVSNQVKIFSQRGTLLHQLEMPGMAAISDWSGDPSQQQCFFSFSSFTQPVTIFELNLSNYTTRVFRSSPARFNSDAYETKQVWYKSYDGTEIPMFIIHKKGLKIDGNRPTLLYSYGGFNVSMLPDFNITGMHLFPVVLENNGICAVANIRGGGEFGQAWHRAATKVEKHKSIDDFQAAAEYLVNNNYTSSKKLAIYGRANGGLLAGASLTQRPDLYRVVISETGIFDMYRYPQFTIGWIWAGDYGTVENREEFDALKYYSPLHNVVPANYPATFITTADEDDQVVPAHSYKFAAELQANQKSDLPVLIRIGATAGHDSGPSTNQKIDEAADILAFMFYNLQQSINYQ